VRNLRARQRAYDAHPSYTVCAVRKTLDATGLCSTSEKYVLGVLYMSQRRGSHISSSSPVFIWARMRVEKRWRQTRNMLQCRVSIDRDAATAAPLRLQRRAVNLTCTTRLLFLLRCSERSEERARVTKGARNVTACVKV